MEYDYTKTGGARVGFINFTKPFAQLSFSPDTIILKVMFLKTYEFSYEQIISMEKHQGIFSQGVRINHNVSSYPENIIFWTGDYQEVINIYLRFIMLSDKSLEFPSIKNDQDET